MDIITQKEGSTIPEEKVKIKQVKNYKNFDSEQPEKDLEIVSYEFHRTKRYPIITFRDKEKIYLPIKLKYEQKISRSNDIFHRGKSYACWWSLVEEKDYHRNIIFDLDYNIFGIWMVAVNKGEKFIHFLRTEIDLQYGSRTSHSRKISLSSPAPKVLT